MGGLTAKKKWKIVGNWSNMGVLALLIPGGIVLGMGYISGGSSWGSCLRVLIIFGYTPFS